MKNQQQDEKRPVAPEERMQGLHPVSLGIRKVVKPLVKKNGLMSSDVILNWEDIVGSDLSIGVHPDRISYPKGKQTDGTLLVTAKNGSYALLFEYRKEQVVQKINRIFGYKAVKGVRISQSSGARFKKEPLSNKKETPLHEISDQEMGFIENAVKEVEDKELKALLERLGKSILSKKSK